MSDWSWVPPADSGIRVRMQPAGGIDFELAELDAADSGTDRLARRRAGATGTRAASARQHTVQKQAAGALRAAR